MPLCGVLPGSQVPSGQPGVSDPGSVPDTQEDAGTREPGSPYCRALLITQRHLRGRQEITRRMVRLAAPGQEQQAGHHDRTGVIEVSAGRRPIGFLSGSSECLTLCFDLSAQLVHR